MNAVKAWIKAHPTVWEFILFNLLSNCATVVNFVVMWCVPDSCSQRSGINPSHF